MPKKGSKYNFSRRVMTFDVLSVPLAFSNDLELAGKLLRCLAKRLAVLQVAALVLAFEFKVPFFRKIFCLANTFFLCTHPLIAAANERRTLPETAVFALVEMESPSH